MTTYALHGFLGRPEDWKQIDPSWHGVELNPYVPFSLNSTISTSENFLVGYSMGGRLALQTLLQEPCKWAGACIISAHPGLQEGKEERLAVDLNWANRFLTDPWEELMSSWNSQPVFGGRGPVRKEQYYERDKLAAMLDVWSLGRQEDLREKIASCPVPIIWVVGEEDEKFCALAKSLRFSHPASHVWMCPGAGHRVPYEAPEVLAKKLSTHKKFISL